VIKAIDARFDFNMLSAVSPKGNLRFMVVDVKVASKQFCEFLRRLCYKATKPIFLILDGHPVHCSAKVKKLVWNELKNNSIVLMSIVDLDDMKRKVLDSLKGKRVIVHTFKNSRRDLIMPSGKLIGGTHETKPRKDRPLATAG
jgi:hypothetical protein